MSVNIGASNADDGKWATLKLDESLKHHRSTIPSFCSILPLQDAKARGQGRGEG